MGADGLASTGIFDPLGRQVIVVINEGERWTIQRRSGFRSFIWIRDLVHELESIVHHW
jgi:hypothetical protein